MGLLLSCCLPSNKSSDDSERARILQDPSDIGFTGEENIPECINTKEINYGTINGSKNENSNAWHHILNKMMSNVIDVTSSNMPSAEPSEIHQKTCMYANRINQLRPPLTLKFRTSNKSNNYVARKNNLESKITSISSEDISLINDVSLKTIHAVKDGFVLQFVNSFVVDFNP